MTEWRFASGDIALPALREVPAPVPRDRGRDAARRPAAAAQAPREVDVLAVDEEVVVEEARRDPRVREGRGAEQRRRSRTPPKISAGRSNRPSSRSPAPTSKCRPFDVIRIPTLSITAVGARSGPSARRIFPVKAATRACSGRSASARSVAMKPGARTTSVFRTRTHGMPLLDGLRDRAVVSARVAQVLARREDVQRHRRDLLERGERRARPVLGRVVDGGDREVAEGLREEGRERAARRRATRCASRARRGPRRHASPGRSADRQPSPRRPRSTRNCAAATSARAVVGADERRENEAERGSRERGAPGRRADGPRGVEREVAELVAHVERPEVAAREARPS